MSDAAAPLLVARGLRKSFAATRALDDVSFDVRAGEVHALCGENGAGKSTLIKVLCGVYPHGSYQGTLALDGRERTFQGVRDAERAGITVIHQELALIPELSIASNVFLGREPKRMGLLDEPRMHAHSRALFERLGLTLDPERPVRELGVGQAQLVEIARALDKEARVLILDEPTAALSPRETSALLDVLRELRRAGVALIYVSHRLEEVFALADRITVLRDGKSVVTLTARATDPQTLVRHMVGRELATVFPERPSTHGDALLRVRDLSADTAHSPLRLRDLTFEVRAGEVLGIGGLVGAGRSELLLHLFGAWGTRRRGRVELCGRALDAPSPSACIAQGMVLVSEDRKQAGLVLGESVRFNMSLSGLGALARHGLVRARAEREACARSAERVELRASLEQPVGTLSGGNQQKVVLGRALLTRPRVLLLDEPTRGVDIGAKAEIYALIAALSAQGTAVVLVSSELPELLGLSDRILMLVEGRAGGHFTRAEASEQTLLAAALPRSKDEAHGS